MDSIITIPQAETTTRDDYHEGFVGIRRFEVGDAALLHAAVRESIEDLSQWMTWCHEGYSVQESEAFVHACGPGWDKGEQYSFVIVDRQRGEFLGSLGLNQVNRVHGFANLGYWVRKSRARRGVAPAAVRLIARFAFEELGLNRLEIVVPTGNRASQRVAEKAGAHREGVLRNRLVLRGRVHDAVMYSLTGRRNDLRAEQLPVDL